MQTIITTTDSKWTLEKTATPWQTLIRMWATTLTWCFHQDGEKEVEIHTLDTEKVDDFDK